MAPKADQELASLKREVDDLRETVAELRTKREQTREQLYQTLQGLGLDGEVIEANVRSLMGHGLTRRAAMLALVGAVGGAGFMSGRVSAAASTGDSDGDVGLPGDRVDVFADGVDAASIANGGSPISLNDALDFGGISGQTTILDAHDAADTSNAIYSSRDAVSVSTSATTIYTIAVNGAVVFVVGRDGSSNRFLDIVQYGGSGSATSTTADILGSPAGRTYSVSSTNLQLAMASNTYNVGTAGFALGVPAP